MRPNTAGPLFCHFDCSPLTRFQFNAVLQKALKFAGLSGEHIRAHSFRIVAASTAVSGGIPIDQVRCMGRWRSNAVATYIGPIAHCEMPCTSVTGHNP